MLSWITTQDLLHQYVDFSQLIHRNVYAFQLKYPKMWVAFSFNQSQNIVQQFSNHRECGNLLYIWIKSLKMDIMILCAILYIGSCSTDQSCSALSTSGLSIIFMIFPSRQSVFNDRKSGKISSRVTHEGRHNRWYVYMLVLFFKYKFISPFVYIVYAWWGWRVMKNLSTLYKWENGKIYKGSFRLKINHEIISL